MIGQRSVTRARTRAVLVGSVVALAAIASMPARAAIPAPRLDSTSVDSGWSNSDEVLRFTFKDPLSLSKSSVKVTDDAGTELLGTVRYGKDAYTIEYVASTVEGSTFVAEQAPYTAVVDAAHWASPYPVSTTTKQFRVDTSRPTNPVIESMSPQVIRDDEDAEIAGYSVDPPGGMFLSPDGTSGVARIVFRIFNPTVSMNDPADTEVVELPCPGGACPARGEFSHSLELEAGTWSVSVQAFDQANNASAQTPGVTYIKLPA